MQIILLENKYPELKEIGTISDIVGAKPSKKLKKIKHLHPMLSLSNAFNKEDLIKSKIKLSH